MRVRCDDDCIVQIANLSINANAGCSFRQAVKLPDTGNLLSLACWGFMQALGRLFDMFLWMGVL